VKVFFTIVTHLPVALYIPLEHARALVVLPPPPPQEANNMTPLNAKETLSARDKSDRPAGAPAFAPL